MYSQKALSITKKVVFEKSIITEFGEFTSEQQSNIIYNIIDITHEALHYNITNNINSSVPRLGEFKFKGECQTSMKRKVLEEYGDLPRKELKAILHDKFTKQLRNKKTKFIVKINKNIWNV